MLNAVSKPHRQQSFKIHFESFNAQWNSKKQSTFNAFRQELVDGVKSSLEKRNMAINMLRELMAA